MRVGISAYDIDGPDVVALAVAAEAVGFSSLWLGEHLVLPVGYSSIHPAHKGSDEHHHAGPIVAPDTRLVDPLIALGAAGTVTTTLELGTAIYLLALRDPLLTARALTTVQELSAGRLLLGVGTGWLVEEFEALGVPFDERVRRFDEAVDVVRLALAGGPFEHRGTFFSTGRIQVTSERVDVPMIFGGNTERALKRAAGVADGWVASGTPTFDEAVRLRDRVMALRRESGRSEPFRCWMRVASCDAKVVERYDAAGFDEVLVWADQVWPEKGTLEQKRHAIATAAETLSLRPRSLRRRSAGDTDC
jgi:probable F420-dependent oxidoreductase